jgi:hypothetical protein
MAKRTGAVAKLLFLSAVIAANAALLAKPARAQAKEDQAGSCYSDGVGDCVCGTLLDMPFCGSAESGWPDCRANFPDQCFTG